MWGFFSRLTRYVEISPQIIICPFKHNVQSTYICKLSLFRSTFANVKMDLLKKKLMSKAPVLVFGYQKQHVSQFVVLNQINMKVKTIQFYDKLFFFTAKNSHLYIMLVCFVDCCSLMNWFFILILLHRLTFVQTHSVHSFNIFIHFHEYSVHIFSVNVYFVYCLHLVFFFYISICFFIVI